MSMVCRIVGHKFQNTVVITQDGDFYEIEDARYCRQCGIVHAKASAC
jgi:hypothetical protein